METAHRPLAVSSPALRGPDVKGLQQALNAQFKRIKIPRRVKVDGVYGPATHRAAWDVAKAMGVNARSLHKFKGGRCGRKEQRLIRGGRKQRPDEKARAKRRAWFRRRLRARARNRRDDVVRALRSHLGVTENPPGSNRGAGIIDRCQTQIIGYAGVPWCGCLAGYILRTAGRVRGITSRAAYTPYLVQDGQAGTNGMKRIVSAAEVLPGDLVVFDFDGGGADHVGIAVAKVRNGQIKSIDGNTSSSDSGSQSNGGGVFERTRPVSLVEAFVRPAGL